MQTTTKGIVIREQPTGESDRIVTLLTADFGLVRAFVRRAKNFKNKNVSSTSLFVYGDFTLYRGRDAFVVDSASPIEVFFELRQDIEKLALAQYFAQVTYYFASEEQPSGEMLRLLLNALHLLCSGAKDSKIIKAAFEMRMLCLSGYMPYLIGCYRCSKYESDIMYFDIEEGCIYCSDCFRNNALTAPLGVISAIRYICFTENIAKVFSFRLGSENLDILADICEKYLLSRVDARLTTLEFYKGLF